MDGQGLDNLKFYQDALQLWDDFWGDSDILLKDVRGREIAIQLTRSVGSVSANIEEGYGRGYGREYPRYLKISRGSAQESKGWYKKSKYLLKNEIIESSMKVLDQIIAMLTATIKTLDQRNKK